MAADELVQEDFNAGIALLPRDRIKQRSVLKELEAHFKTVNITSHAIKRMVRIKTDKLYVAAVQHCYRCKNYSNCEARLNERHSTTIALVCMQHELERLLSLFELDDQHDDLQNVEKDVLKDIMTRTKRSTAFAALIPVTQTISCMQTVKLLDSAQFDYMTECLDCDEPKQLAQPTQTTHPTRVQIPSEASTTSLPLNTGNVQLENDKKILSASITTMNRTPSLCSNGTESPGPPSKSIELRDSILSVFLAHRSELKISVRDAALEMINNNAFKRLVESDDNILRMDSGQIAFCMLSALHFQSMQHISSMHVSSKMNVGIADKLNLGIISAEHAIDAIKGILPDQNNGEECSVYSFPEVVQDESSDNDLFD